jgi:hypothetical protein
VQRSTVKVEFFFEFALKPCLCTLLKIDKPARDIQIVGTWGSAPDTEK